MPRTNGDKVREVAVILRTIGESVLMAIDEGDFDENDLMWFQQRVESENEALYNLVADYFGTERMFKA